MAHRYVAERTEILRVIRLTACAAACLLAACVKDATAPAGKIASPVCESQAAIGLQPGQAVLLPAGDSLCSSVGNKGLYAVAYLDIAPTEAARAGKEIHLSIADSFSVTVDFGPPGTASGAPAPASPRAMPSSPSPPASDAPLLTDSAQALCALSTSAWCHETPWAVGDRLTIGDMAARSATVVAVDSPLVLAEWSDDVPLEGADGVLANVFDEAARTIVPKLNAAFGSESVTTSPGSGELVVVAQNGAASWTASWPSTTTSSSLILLSINPDIVGDIGTAHDLRVLAHEMTHAWQYRYLYREAGNPPPWAPPWAIEGGADFFAMEYMRSFFGIALDANGEPSPDDFLRSPQDVYWHYVNRSQGRIELGYYAAEPLLRHLMVRLIQAGESEPQALSTVLTGSLEGWFGPPNTDWHPPGLAARMGAALGRAWDPVEGVLSWTLSNALDDRSSGTEYDIPTVLDAWQQEGLSGFPPSGSLSHGRQTSTRYAGSTGYFELSVGDEPDSRLILSYTGKQDTTAPPGVGEPPPVVRWMVGRIN